MNIQADKGDADFNVLTEYLRAELERSAADQRAVHLASEESFAKWAQDVLGHIAEKLGVALGYLAGLAQGAYESIKGGFGKGFEAGFRRGRGQ
jgi:hypothetical protein